MAPLVLRTVVLRALTLGTAAITWAVLFAIDAAGLERPTVIVVIRLLAGMALVGAVVHAIEQGRDWVVAKASTTARRDLRTPTVLAAGLMTGVGPAALLMHRIGGLPFFQAQGHGAVIAAAALVVVAALAAGWLLAPEQPSPRQLVAGGFGAAISVGLFLAVNHHAATLVVVPVGRLGLHLQFYIATWAASVVGTWLLAARAVRRVAPSAARLGLGALAVIGGITVALADQRLYVGLYPAVHLWLKAHAYLAMDLGLGWLVVERRPVCRAWIAWAAAATLGLSGLPALDTLERASLASGAWGRPLVRLLDRTPAQEGPTTPDATIDAVLDARGESTAMDGTRPNLLLLTVDALRADSVPPGGAIARLMDQGVAYARAYAPGAQTDVSMSALMTGRYPLHLPWRSAFVTERAGGWELLDRPPTHRSRWAATAVPGPYSSPLLAERLKSVGYRTAAVAFVGDDILLRQVLGLSAGFDSFPQLASHGWDTPSDPAVVDHAIAQIERLAAEASDKPWFLWVHLYDPHEAGGDRARYDTLVAQTDKAIGRLLAATAQSSAQPTAIALSADHGELFGEHGRTGHGASLHQEAIHIPMALVAPGLGARTEPRPVSLLDLTATFCALAGADRSGLDGYSLLGPALGRPYPADRPIFSEAVRFYRRGGRTSVHLQAMVRGHHKLTWDRLIVTDTLIDLRDDPGEIDNLALRRPVRTAELARVLRYWVARGERLNPSPPSRPAPSP